MSTITQYRPAYFAGFENEVVAFDTIDALLAIPFVANFRTVDGFHRYSVWCEDGAPARLMAEYETGRRWLVVGTFDGEAPCLPNWEPPHPEHSSPHGIGCEP
jgi:hypothetical protein